jgi:hypothetical protein
VDEIDDPLQEWERAGEQNHLAIISDDGQNWALADAAIVIQLAFFRLSKPFTERHLEGRSASPRCSSAALKKARPH